ncbi:DUF2976 domain-containing protein [Lampropedia puyangensis]|uniref:DUF2976 domain-containing protein n=1 Tax=Lampropedia puyangensis TaxID=1330072 RepID=A0A4S8EXP0_9BURK|nr:DUF2976 domain-containing protein [Lampropedia puyangensis]THT98403.1 DUF2976 domain-containing protein [Lampropedia puyangensis]
MQSVSRLARAALGQLSTKSAFALPAFVALLLVGLPAEAALPTIAAPDGIDGASCGAGDWLCAMGGYFKQGITILGLIFAALAFLIVVAGGLSKWKDYSKGRLDMSELKEYMIVAAIFAIFIVVMVTYAFEVFTS